ncbi:MAG: hypothetical protein HDT04_01080 [Bacteroidales bacterium]|nr:hypothetical protein [Bacteroidales bacterium]
MTIAISVDNILKTVFAHSAIKNTTDQKPEILSEHDSPALRQLLYYCTCRIASQLVGIANFNAAKSDIDKMEILTFETTVNPAEPLGTTLRMFIESALVAALLASIWREDHDLSGVYTSLTEQNIKSIRSQFSTTSYRIKPSA